jgi:hypothetical protein
MHGAARSSGGRLATLIALLALAAAAVTVGVADAFTCPGVAGAVARGMSPTQGAYPDGAMTDSTTLGSPGAVLAASGDTLVAGTDVYVRGPGGWTLQQHLDPPGQPGFDTPGLSVAIGGDVLVMGFYEASGRGEQVGQVYIYRRSAGVWTLESTLAPQGATAYRSFGQAVAVSGDSVLVGAPFVTVKGMKYSGVVYAYQYGGGTWVQSDELVAADAEGDDNFGCAIAMQGSTAVIGASMHGTPVGTNQGAGYVFAGSNGTWTQRTRLLVDDGDQNIQLGSAVAFDGDTVLLSALRSGDSRGAVYAFVRRDGAWRQQARLAVSDAAMYDMAGVQIALSGDRALVGSLGGWTVPRSGRGVVTLFERSGSAWHQSGRFAPQSADPASPDTGHSYNGGLAIVGRDLLIGAAPLLDFRPYVTDPGRVLDVPARDGVLVNDVASGAAPLVAQLARPPQYGDVQLAADGSFVYTPPSGFVGVETFAYTATDGSWTSPPATVSVNIRDAAAPTATAEGVPSGWTNRPVTVTLAAPKATTLSSIDYRRLPRPGEWTTWRRYVRPITVDMEGATRYGMRTHDIFGHLREQGGFKVKLDTRPPTILSLGRASGRKGGAMTFTFRIVDPRPGSPTARVTIDIYTRSGNALAGVSFFNRPVNRLLTCTCVCPVNAGKYRISVSARDRAGNVQMHAAHGVLIVR